MSVKHECKRCGYNGGTKQALVKHFLRKQTCEPLTPDRNCDIHLLYVELTGKEFERFKCDFCDHESSSISNNKTHMQTCVHRKTQDLNKIPGSLSSESIPKAVLEELASLRKELDDLRAKKNPTTSIGNIQINNFNLQPFGKEETGHLDHEFLTNCLLNQAKGVTTLLNRIHFDPQTPQNNNIRVKSKKQNLLEKVVDDGSWEQCDKNNTLDDMIRKGYKILFSHFIANKEEDIEIKERTEDLQMWFTDMCSKKGEEYYRLRRDMYVLVLNNTVYILGKI